MDKQIIVVKPKTLSSKDKEKLTKSGNIVIEHENANEITYHQSPEILPLVHTLCTTCGDMVYMTKERLEILKWNKFKFYCTRGHENGFL